jgi:hypothetical protein
MIMAMSRIGRLLREARGLSALLGLVALAACDSSPDNPCPNLLDPGDSAQASFIVVRRPWQAGEREQLIANIKSQQSLSLPYVGNISDNAELLFDPVCASDIVANTGPSPVSPIAQTSPFGPTYSLNAVRVPGAGWTSSGVDVHIVNNQQSGDTFDWLITFWVNQAEPTWKGYIIGASAATTLAATTVNTTNFDNGNDKTGVGGGEARASTATVWNANGTGSPNTYRVLSSGTTGGSSTVTTGPFLGGTSAPFTMNQTISNVGMARVQGSGTPTTQTANLTGTITGVSYSCVFPSPCTTNVPNVAAAALRHQLTDAEYAQLPWIAALPPATRPGVLRARAQRRAKRPG